MAATTKERAAMDSRRPLSKKQRKTLNRKLAAALRSYGLPANGDTWTQAKSLMHQGMTPKAAARLTRSTLPAEAQDAAIARAPKVTKAEVAQVPTPSPSELTVEDCKAALTQGRARGLVSEERFSELLEALVTAEAAELDTDPERTVVLSSRAIDVREGRVRRDAKGRLLPA